MEMSMKLFFYVSVWLVCRLEPTRRAQIFAS